MLLTNIVGKNFKKLAQHKTGNDICRQISTTTKCFDVGVDSHLRKHNTAYSKNGASHINNGKQCHRNFSIKSPNTNDTMASNYTRSEDGERYFDILFDSSGEEAHFQKGHPFYPKLKDYHMNEIIYHQPEFNYQAIIKSFKEEESANQLNIHQYNCILPLLPARKQLFYFDKLIGGTSHNLNNKKRHSNNNMNIRPNLTTVHTIVSRLIYEGKRDMAKEFMLHNLEHVGTIHEVPEELNHLFLMNHRQLNKNRHSLLTHLIKNKRKAKAWEFFNQLRANLLARTDHYAKMLPLCDDVKYIYQLLDEMRSNEHIVGLNQPHRKERHRKHGRAISKNCYMALIEQLLIECYSHDNVIKIIGEQLKIDGNLHMKNKLYSKATTFTKSIKNTIIDTKRNIKIEDIASQLNGAKALQYYQLLYRNKKLDKYNLTSIMKSLCSADLCSELLDNLQYYEDIIETDNVFYMPYVSSLVYEGRKEEAREFVYDKLPQLGVKVDSRLTDILNVSDHFLHIRRKTRLSNLRAAGREQDAVLLYEVMLDSGIKPINFTGHSKAYDAMWNEFKHERYADNGVGLRNLNILERGMGNKRNLNKGLIHKILDRFEVV